jgi:hypothetical protein
MVANLLISQTASVSHSTTQARPNIFLESFFSFLSTSKNGFLSISLSLSLSLSLIIPFLLHLTSNQATWVTMMASSLVL